MSTTNDEYIAPFLRTVERLKMIIGEHGEIAKAKLIPDHLAHDIRLVQIGNGGHYNPASDAAVQAVKTAAAGVIEAERRRGEALRDEKLASLSAEIGALRAILPKQAARAAIVLGDIEHALKGNHNDG